jgi:transposase InsO family protein
VLEVSHSGFYAAQRQTTREKEEADRRLLVEIRSIHRASKRRYGSLRVHEELKAQGIRCGRKRFERLMREDGFGPPLSVFVRRAGPAQKKTPSPNLNTGSLSSKVENDTPPLTKNCCHPNARLI